jgi:hypothetical protein
MVQQEQEQTKEVIHDNTHPVAVLRETLLSSHVPSQDVLSLLQQ